MGNGEREDKVGEKWEMDALCILGIDANTRDDVECPGDDLLEFTAQFTRSLGGEFGTTIRSDGPSMGIAIMLIIGYLIINLSRFDHKYSMIAMSMAEVLAIGMSYAAAMGMSSYLNLPNNQLNLNIPFLLAGLGVDDAFVIGSEFQLNRLRHPDMDIPNLIALTAQTGGISILITSVTDALAFLVGSATVIPVLSWFCVNVGIGVIFCFIFQITIFLPALALNERRVLADRLDCLCCFKRGCLDILCCKNGKEWRNDHPTAPNGCCCCCFPKSCRVKPEVLDANLKRIEDAKTVGEREITLAEINNGTLGSLMKTYAEFITSKVGLIFTGLVFLALFAFGILGATRIYKDFKLEWFVPDGSYVNVFFKYNNEYYASGSPCSLYVYDTNMFKEQKGFHQLKKYMNSSKYFDQDSGVTDWYAKFQESATGMNATAMGGIDTSVDGEPIYENESLFYTNLHDWLTSAAGGRYRNNIHWNDAPCDESNQTAVTCDPTKGIKEARWQATLSLAETSTGDKRYETMTSVRAEMKKMFPTASAFPYSYNFLYWEEVGVIDVELMRNLLICGGVIICIIAILIPNFLIAAIVVVNICVSVVEILGLMHWWGVTISVTSTIYILLSVGLCVDYSAHIAHIFVISTGTARERSISALTRIGPCTFHAIISTFLAVVVLFFSKSYVFRVFFKALCLVVFIGGSHGIFLLPAILSVVGGSREPEAIESSHIKPMDQGESKAQVGKDKEGIELASRKDSIAV